MSGDARVALFGHLGRHVAIYALGDLAVRATGFLLIPLYTRRLPLEAFGILGIIQIIEAGLVLVLNMGMSTAIMRRVREGGANLREDVFSTAVVLCAVAALLLGTLAVLAPSVTPLIFGDSLSPGLFRWVLVGILFSTLKLFIVSLLRAERRPVPYVGFNIAHFVAIMGLNIVLIAGLGYGLRGAIWGNATAALIVVLAMTPLILRRIRPGWRPGVVKELLVYGLPLMPGMLAMWVVAMSNRFFIQHHHGPEAVGLYTLGFRIALVLQIAVVTPFRTAWLPIMFSLEDKPDARTIYSLVLTYFVGVGTFAALAIALMAPEVVAVLAPVEYASAASVAPLLVLAYLIYGIYFLLDNGLLLSGRTRLYPVVAGTAAAVNIGLSMLLVPTVGILGAAIGSVLSYLLLAIVMGRVSRLAYPIPYEFGRAAIPLLVGAALYGIGSGAAPHLVGFGLGVKLICLAAYPGLLLAAGYFKRSERRKILSLFR